MGSKLFRISFSSLFVLMFSFFISFRSYYFFGFVSLFPILGVWALFIISFYYSSKLNVSTYVYSLTLIILSLIWLLLTDLFFFGVVKLFTCIIAFFVFKKFSTFCFKVSDYKYISSLNLIVHYFVIFLLLECFLRFFYGERFIVAHAVEYEVDSYANVIAGGFYKFKLGSPFFQDSNFVALFLLPLLMMVLSLKDSIVFYNGVYKYKILLFVLLFLSLLTLSRSLYFALILMFSLNFILNMKYENRILVILIAPLLAIPSLLMVIDLVKDDYSFVTKILVWKDLFHKFYEQPILNSLFGHGFENGKYIFSYSDGASSHSLVPQLIGEVGLVGLLFYILFLYYMVYNISSGLVFFITILVIGFSLYDPWDPLYFCMFGILANSKYLNSYVSRKMVSI